MKENLELIGRLGQSIATDPALGEPPWQACATVFSFSINGVCEGHYGYAYDGDGRAHPFTLDRVAAKAMASDYVRWRGGSVRQMLFQFDPGSGRYALVLEHEQPRRWQATPDIRIDGAAAVEFEDAAGAVHRHEVPASGGWLHVGVRVHAGLGCRADAIITQTPEHRASESLDDGDVGVRVQPFFLARALPWPMPARLGGAQVRGDPGRVMRVRPRVPHRPARLARRLAAWLPPGSADAPAGISLDLRGCAEIIVDEGSLADRHHKRPRQSRGRGHANRSGGALLVDDRHVAPAPEECGPAGRWHRQRREAWSSARRRNDRSQRLQPTFAPLASAWIFEIVLSISTYSKSGVSAIAWNGLS